MDKLVQEIKTLQKEKDAVILAHYYVNEKVQAVADYIGDSYYLSKVAATIPQKVICFCGVSFMGESAKILNPDKTVVMPDALADCPMAHMVDINKIQQLKEQYKDLAVVCYINSTAELKTHADVCVTSANALKIVKALPNQNIFFIPDENLGRYIASRIPEKNFIFNDGYCHVHTSITRENVMTAKKAKPEALVLVHPECKPQVCALADYIGSTSGIIDFATQSNAKDFIIGTEMGVLYELKQKNPNKHFYSATHGQYCPNMKKITLEKVRDILQNMDVTVEVEDSVRIKANRPLKKMLELAK